MNNNELLCGESIIPVLLGFSKHQPWPIRQIPVTRFAYHVWTLLGLQEDHYESEKSHPTTTVTEHGIIGYLNGLTEISRIGDRPKV